MGREPGHYEQTDIADDLALQRRVWRVERLGWVTMLAIVVLSIAGLFGDGLFTDATVTSSDSGLAVEYPRTGRLQTSMRLAISASAEDADGRELRVWIDRGYLDALELERVTPAASRAEGDARRLVLVFEVDPGKSDRAQKVTLDVRPLRWGRIRGQCGAGRSSVAFSHFVFP